MNRYGSTPSDICAFVIYRSRKLTTRKCVAEWNADDMRGSVERMNVAHTGHENGCTTMRTRKANSARFTDENK